MTDFLVQRYLNIYNNNVKTILYKKQYYLRNNNVDK